MKTHCMAKMFLGGSLLSVLLFLAGAISVRAASDSRQGSTSSSSQNSKPAAPVNPLAEEEKRGDVMMARKEYAEAAEAYKPLVKQQPHNAVYLNKLGIAYHLQNNLGLALRYYERAAKADKHYPDAVNNIGTIHYQRKKYQKAIRTYQKALAIRADMPSVLSNLGYAYFSAKQYDEAMGAFQQALRLDPEVFERSARGGSLLQDRSVGEKGMFYFLLAKSFAQAGNTERCIRYLRKARDEGYAAMATVKTDPAFAAVLKNPGVQELLGPPTAAEDKKP